MQKSAKIALVAVVLVVVLGGLGFYWFVFRDTAPPVATLPTLSSTPGGTAGGGSAASANGTWVVQPDTSGGEQPQVFVGYRINETFAGDTIQKEAVGRTVGVTGTMTVDGQNVKAAEITGDLSTLKSDRDARDNFIKNRGLETAKFGEATFKLTQPIALPSAPKLNEEIKATATGDLTLHGQTKSVTVPITATWNGSQIGMTGKADIAIADYGIEKISIPTVSVQENGVLEFALVFVPQGGSS